MYLSPLLSGEGQGRGQPCRFDVKVLVCTIMVKKKTKTPQILWNNPHLDIPNVYKFDVSLNKAFNEYMTPRFEDKKEEFIIAYMNRMIGRTEQTTVANASSPEGKFLAEISIGAFEIFNTYESLLDAEIYIRKFPYSRTRISKSRHLKSIITSHLQNIFILRERMVRYLKVLRKRYSKNSSADGKLTLEITKILEDYTKDAFSHLNSVRNIHVHVEELYDAELEQLALLESFIINNSTISSLDEFKEYYDFEFNRIRKNKIKEIKKINADTEEALDMFFGLIYSIVFDESDNFITATTTQ